MESKCQRCHRGLPATHRVKSEIIKLDVCDLCAQEALKLPQEEPGRVYVSLLPAQAA